MANYRWDSDVPRPYGYFMKNNSPLPQDGEKNPNSNRTIYADELAKYITVNVYGGCGTKKCARTEQEECFHMLKNYYKFYLF